MSAFKIPKQSIGYGISDVNRFLNSVFDTAGLASLRSSIPARHFLAFVGSSSGFARASFRPPIQQEILTTQSFTLGSKNSRCQRRESITAAKLKFRFSSSLLLSSLGPDTRIAPKVLCAIYSLFRLLSQSSLLCSSTQSTRRFANLCRRRESNPHALRHTILSRARLPIPPLRQIKKNKACAAFCDKSLKQTAFVLRGGLEPPTPGSSDQCSNQLSYLSN